MADALHVIKPEDWRRMPWRNGGGTTCQIAISPPGASLEEFTWRVSLADIERSGRFSSFPGCDRTIMLVDGAGMTLDVDGRRVNLERFRFFDFPGEATVEAHLSGGPATDLNVIVSRSAGAFAHEALTLHLGAEAARKASDQALAVVLEGEATVTCGGRELVLPARHALRVTAPGKEIRFASHRLHTIVAWLQFETQR